MQVALMIGVHSYGTVLPPFAGALATAAGQLAAWGIPFAVQIVEDCLVERGRDRLAQAFMASRCTHLLMIDGDIEFAPDAILTLLRADEDLVAASYHLKNDANAWATCFSLSGQDCTWDAARRLLEVDSTGTGFMMIRRAVFDRLAEAMPELAYEADLPEGKGRIHAFFESVRGPSADGSTTWKVTEDLTFCRRWRAIGGRVWIAPDIELAHYGRRVWRGRVADALNLPPPALAAE